MADAPNHGKGTREVWIKAIAFVVTAAAIGVYVYRSPQEDRARSSFVRIATALGWSASKDDRPRKPIDVVIREIEHGDEVTRTQTITLLFYDLRDRAEFARVFPHLVRATKDQSEMVRGAALSVLDHLIRELAGNARELNDRKLATMMPDAEVEETLAELLNEPTPALRARAAGLLRTLAAAWQLEFPPPRLVACLDDESEEVRAAAAESVIEFGQGPELFLPVALRRLPTESPIVRGAYTHILWNIRFPPTVLPLLIDGLSSDNALVCVSAATMINHMGLPGKPARPAVMALLRKELVTPHLSMDLRLIAWGDGSAVPTSGVSLVIVGAETNGVLHFRIFGPTGNRVTDTDESKLPAQAGAISALKKQLRPLWPPHALSHAEKALVIAGVTSIAGQTQLNQQSFGAVDIIEQTTEALMQCTPEGEPPLPGTFEILCEVLKRPNEMGQNGVAWSLGLLGRSAAPAVPQLISTFEAAPKNSEFFRGRIALALAQISQGTADEDRVIESLAKAWPTVQSPLKTHLTAALRMLGPKAEKLVPELRKLPRLDPGPRIQRGYSPRRFLEKARGLRGE